MYEYRVTQLLAGGNIQHLNDRIGHMVAEGWEPIFMTGDAIISVMLRRPVEAAAAHPAHAAPVRHPSLMPPDQPTAPVQPRPAPPQS